MLEEIRLEVTSGAHTIQTVTIGSKLLCIGRDPANHVVLDSAAVRPFHAFVMRVEEGVRVQCWPDAPGFTIAGASRTEAVLACGDSLQIGSFALWARTIGARPSPDRSVASDSGVRASVAVGIEGLLDSLSALFGVTDQQAILETLLEWVTGFMQASRGFVVLCRDQAFTPIVGGRALDPGAVETFSRTVCQRALASRSSVLLAMDRQGDEIRDIQSLSQRNLGFVLAIPLIDAGEVLGILYVESLQTRPQKTEQLAEIAIRIQTVGGRALRAALQKKEIIGEKERWQWLASTLNDHPDIERTARSAVMKPVIKLVRRCANEDVAVLLRGETGTGKERTAMTIHRLSRRRDAPFVAVNCNALPRDLIEAELFGYERGAFTGATEAHPGCFEVSKDGTLLLDEVGDLGRDLQVKLLRVLETRDFKRLGAKASHRWTGRLIAATNVDLEAAVARGEFREDLYYRLNVVSIELPPLRDRMDDLELLVHELLLLTNRKFRQKLYGVDDEALKVMRSYRWPGNIRELKNILERAFIIEESERITRSSLPLWKPSREGAPVPKPALAGAEPSLSDYVAKAEQVYIETILARVRGNMTHAAKILGIARPSLYRKVKQLGILLDAAPGDDAPDAPEEPGR
jgi:transcriptional regulator with PAS, ATPase and Fis domain